MEKRAALSHPIYSNLLAMADYGIVVVAIFGVTVTGKG
jgi:hypothetical protein